MKRKHNLYDYKWQKIRKQYLEAHPLCVMCYREGRTTVATVVDHIIPHKGNEALFYDEGNYQSLCQHCHDSHKKYFEMTGRVRGCNDDGTPTDPNHPWNNLK